MNMRKGLLGVGLIAVLHRACSREQPKSHHAEGASAAPSGGSHGLAGSGGASAGSNAAAGVAQAGSAVNGGSPAAGGPPSVGGAAVGGSATGGAFVGGSASVAGGPNGGAPSAGAAGMGGSVAAAGDGSSGVAGSGGFTSGGTAGTGGAGAGGSGGRAPVTSLHEKYEELFPIGAAVDSQSYMTHAAILTQHFNSVTPENEMKFESLQGTQGSFTYAAADAIVNFALQNAMKVRGHTLVWHSQNPSWLFAGASRDTLLTRMRTHISNVMGHFKGKVYLWDVVNEAIMEDGNYRTGAEEEGKQSEWYEIIGEDYIAEAFRAAHEADPDAKLFYNDYYDYIPAKQQGIYNMLKGLIEDGVPIHGVGMQTHLNIEPSTNSSNQAYYQNVANLEDAIELYSSLGLEVQVTEMDVSLYIPGVTYTTDTFYTQATFTEALQIQQAERYRAFFELFRKHADSITSVTLWGIADDNTWLSEFSSGRKDFPLLFDTAHKPKQAYDAVVDF
jgi:endo-1,4-beta-xylanase